MDASTSITTSDGPSTSSRDDWLSPGELYYFKTYINGEIQAAFYELAEKNGMLRKSDAENIIKKAFNSSATEIQKQEPLRHFLAKINIDSDASKDRIDKICDTMRAMHYIEKRANEIEGLLKKTKKEFVKLGDKFGPNAPEKEEDDNVADCDYIIKKMVEITERLEFIESSVPVIKAEFNKLKNVHAQLISKKVPKFNASQ